VAWIRNMSDAVAKRRGSKKIYDTRIATGSSPMFWWSATASRPTRRKPVRKFLEAGWRREFIPSSRCERTPSSEPSRISTCRPTSPKAMLEGVRLSDYADNRRSCSGAGSD